MWRSHCETEIQSFQSLVDLQQDHQLLQWFYHPTLEKWVSHDMNACNHDHHKYQNQKCRNSGLQQINFTMNKNNVHIHMVHLPSLRYNNGQKWPNRVHLCNRCKCICIFHSLDLRESFRYQPSLILYILTIDSNLVPIDPLALHQFHLGGQASQLPSLVVL